jgi:hypothetical protein
VKIRRFLAVGTVMLAVFFIGTAIAKQSNTAKTTDLCSLSQQSGFMNSWAGQPAAPDHSEFRPLKQNAWVGCWAGAAIGSTITPACVLTFENGGQYTLPSRTAMNLPKSDVVTLSCNGVLPVCCKIQVAGGLAQLKKATPDLQVMDSKDARTPKDAKK